MEYNLKAEVTLVVTNTRMQDFFDLISLHNYKVTACTADLHKVLAATTKRHGSDDLLKDTQAVFNEVAVISDM